MEYTNYILFAAGLAGVLIHNLMKMDDINRQEDGNINLYKYWRLERFSIMFSLVFVAVCVIGKHEIKQLEQAGNWLAFAFFALGYMAQSFLVKIRGKIKKATDD